MRISVLAVAMAFAVAGPGLAADKPKNGAAHVSPTPTPTPEPIELPGTVFTRKDGSYLTLTLEGGQFKLLFFNSTKQPMPANVPRATIRWNPKQKFGEQHAILNPTADGLALKGNVFVQPPFPIHLFVNLLTAEGTVSESFQANFRP